MVTGLIVLGLISGLPMLYLWIASLLLPSYVHVGGLWLLIEAPCMVALGLVFLCVVLILIAAIAPNTRSGFGLCFTSLFIAIAAAFAVTSAMFPLTFGNWFVLAILAAIPAALIPLIFQHTEEISVKSERSYTWSDPFNLRRGIRCNQSYTYSVNGETRNGYDCWISSYEGNGTQGYCSRNAQGGFRCTTFRANRQFSPKEIERFVTNPNQFIEDVRAGKITGVSLGDTQSRPRSGGLVYDDRFRRPGQASQGGLVYDDRFKQ